MSVKESQLIASPSAIIPDFYVKSRIRQIGVLFMPNNKISAFQGFVGLDQTGFSDQKTLESIKLIEKWEWANIVSPSNWIMLANELV